MISHKHKCIFIHIPKCAGTSIKYFLFPDEIVHWFDANYDVVHGWCPKRKFFMQHATSKQLVETGLISKEQWDAYFKFTFVRNPWDRAVSDYFWMMKDRKIKDSFKNYIDGAGKFKKLLQDTGTHYYRGEHVIPQTDFFDVASGEYQMDFIGRFENFENDMQTVLASLNMDQPFETHINKGNNNRKHYSRMYTDALKEQVATRYQEDIAQFGYNFDDQRTFLDRLKLKFS